jgi:phage replication-related protein YjqB (UPF0714/DUF867 family)
MERVKIISGKIPVIIVAPHGVDDERTSTIAQRISEEIHSFAVINLGWERSQNVDFMKDKADCNNTLHCYQDVVKEEFLDPIIRYKNKILKTNNEAYIFYIHGMSNKHRITANDPTMDIVVGYGVGIPNSITFDPWKKNCLVSTLEELGFGTYEASQGSSMSGWSKNNMNQLFRKWHYEPKVNSIQLELVHELRESNKAAEWTAVYLSEAIIEAIQAKKFNISVSNKIY